AFAQPDSLLTLAETEYLRVALDRNDGSLFFQLAEVEDAPVSHPHPLALLADGVEEHGFVPVSILGNQLRNDRLDVEIELLHPRAIAVTWKHADGIEHDFQLNLRATYSTAYYGTGERFHALNHRGYHLPLKTDDRADNKGVGAYKPIPFFMTTDGYGIWVDSFSPGTFDLEASERFIAKLSFRDDRFRVVVMAGPDFGDILGAFTDLTGRSSVPPPWAFALWKSRDVHPNQDSVYADIERLRRYDIPASVLVLDSPWETGYNDFNFNTLQFPDTAAMFDRIESLGFNLALWLTPFINKRNVLDMRGIMPETSTFEEADTRGFLVSDSAGHVMLSEWWKGEGGLVDFTNPEAIEWWFEQLDKTLAYRARAFKCDDGEGNFVPHATFHDGTPAAKMKNRYAALYDSVMQAYLDTRLEGDGAMITRSGYTGTQRYSFDWAGDNRANFSFEDGLPTAITAGQNAALSGIALWGSDIAGYFGRPDPELFVRWTQFGAFSPFMQVHMTSNQGPWDFGPEALDIFRTFARLRVQLFPYLHEAVNEAARTGLPVIRPMVLAFQGDRAAAEARYQYMFGPDILVAPMYQSGTYRSVYLPEGEWIDWWDGAIYPGNQTMEVHVPLDEMPLFVRSGAVIPMLPDDVDTLVPRTDRIDADVVTLDDRRVIQIWPGERWDDRSWDGLQVELEKSGRVVTMIVETSVPRRIGLQLRHRKPTSIMLRTAWLAGGDPGTHVLDLGWVEGSRTVKWEEE
ncbi:MAG TPA: TIM-barrel domain-containing protein, partial [Rhodothermia bacterium]|nr:TIM-barrel domain-containing protein [Rhodothermia bacterium]